MAHLTKENQILLERVQKKEKGNPDVIIEANLAPEDKADRIRAALPFNTNEAFLNVIEDPEGDQILQGLLQDIILDGIGKGEFTLDTSAKSRTFTNTIVHALFSEKYVDNLRMYNPRDNYQQAEGTAMVKPVFTWLQDTVLTIVAEILSREGVETSPFEWDQFMAMLRDTWKWAKNNIRKKKNRAAKKAEK